MTLLVLKKSTRITISSVPRTGRDWEFEQYGPCVPLTQACPTYVPRAKCDPEAFNVARETPNFVYFACFFDKKHPLNVLKCVKCVNV